MDKAASFFGMGPLAWRINELRHFVRGNRAPEERAYGNLSSLVLIRKKRAHGESRSVKSLGSRISGWELDYEKVRDARRRVKRAANAYCGTRAQTFLKVT